MSDERSGGVKISTRLDGTFDDISLRESVLAQAVRSGADRWTQPILLYGPDGSAEVDALLRTAAAEAWLEIRAFRDLAGRRRTEFSEMEGRLDSRFYETQSGAARTRLAEILRGQQPFNDLIDFVALGPSGQGYLNRTGIGRDFTDAVERLCSTTGLILPWQMRNSFLSAFVLAVWTQRPRLRPLILHAPKRFGVPSGEGIEVPTGGVRFEALAEEAEQVFGMSRADVEKAYRVWQLSRVGDTTKPQATTPRTINREVAREFLSVLARARPDDRQIGIVAPQKAAPLMFELEGGGVGLKHGVSATDTEAIIRTGAASLGRRVERLQHDAHFGNVVPSSKDMLALIASILSKFPEGGYADADIVELGLELNALQWHVDPVRHQLGEVSIGELTGLFATANLFLGRFAVWQEYTGSSAASGKPEDGVAAFDVAMQLLQSARERAAFLTPEANRRIGVVLDRTAADNEAPPLREGLVRSGENLAAVTAEGLSRVMVDEAKALGAKTKEKVYEEASSAIVSYAVKNGPLLLRLGEIRNWPWLSWLHQLIP